jgi:hypothetical protein
MNHFFIVIYRLNCIYSAGIASSAFRRRRDADINVQVHINVLNNYVVYYSCLRMLFAWFVLLTSSRRISLFSAIFACTVITRICLHSSNLLYNFLSFHIIADVLMIMSIVANNILIVLLLTNEFNLIL